MGPVSHFVFPLQQLGQELCLRQVSKIVESIFGHSCIPLLSHPILYACDRIFWEMLRNDVSLSSVSLFLGRL